jgi:hypothetical protein
VALPHKQSAAQLLAIAFLCFGWKAAAAEPISFRWTVGRDVAAPQFNHEDADAGVVRDGGNIFVQLALWPHWYRFSGPDLDHLNPLSEARRDASFNRPHGDDSYWTDGIWKDPAGRLYAIVHIEYDYAHPRMGFLWRRRIGLATSDDKGANWHYEGDILTTNPKRSRRPSPNFVDFGCGDTYLFVDQRNGFFYLFYMTAWVDARSGARVNQTMSGARSPITARMAAGSWMKWNGTGWTEPGLGGAEADIFPGADSAVVHFNTYLNTYIAMGRDSDGSSWITACPSLDREQWGTRNYRLPQRLYWYNWPVDSVTGDRYEIGQAFRIYSSQANVNGVGSKYMNVTLLPGK